MNQIKETLAEITKQYFGFDLAKLSEQQLKENIFTTQSGYNLQARDLLYIFFGAEKAFNITFTQESIAAGDFSTFEGIIQAISRRLQQKDSANG